jgi:O-antigen/teichoic acid export membrane protein
MDRLHRSIFFSGVERYGSAFFFFVSTAILSRLLKPEEFGIYAAVIALTAVATACSQEFGGANYSIQKATLTEQDIRTAFTVTFFMSALLGAAFFELRDAVASFYSEEGLRTGIAVFAAGFLLMPFSTTISALLRREMAFDVLARCNLTAAFITASASIGLVALGWSFLGLLIGSVIGQAAALVLLMSARRDLRIFRPSFRGWRDVIGFGAYSSAMVIINVVEQSWPQLILGRILDFTAVGLYGRAAGAPQLFDKLFVGVLNPVIMPAIAAQSRAGGFETPLPASGRVAHGGTVAVPDFHGPHGRADRSDLVRYRVDRGRSARPYALPGFPRLIRGVPDLSCAGRGRPGPRHSLYHR